MTSTPNLPAYTSESKPLDQLVEPTLAYFWAPWCSPCQMMRPVLERMTRRDGERTLIDVPVLVDDGPRDTKVDVLAVNVDEESGICEAMDVTSIPTLILLRNGKPVRRISGFRAEAALREWLIGAFA